MPIPRGYDQIGTTTRKVKGVATEVAVTAKRNCKRCYGRGVQALNKTHFNTPVTCTCIRIYVP